MFMLREAEQRVQQAAEFGQALLQQTELLKRENSRLAQEREDAATQLEENEWRMDELETERAHLQDMISAQHEEMKVPAPVHMHCLSRSLALSLSLSRARSLTGMVTQAALLAAANRVDV